MPRRAEMAIDKLLSQLSNLAEATESNNQLSKLIFSEVSSDSRRPNGLGESPKASNKVESRLLPILDRGKLGNLIKSQSQILEEHKMILSEVEVASRELKSQRLILGKENPVFNNDLKALIEQFVDGIGEFQNLVSVLIHQNNHIQKNLRTSK
jgi:hypothetical protein